MGSHYIGLISSNQQFIQDNTYLSSPSYLTFAGQQASQAEENYYAPELQNNSVLSQSLDL
jgi:hypothetical protein